MFFERGLQITQGKQEPESCVVDRYFPLISSILACEVKQYLSNPFQLDQKISASLKEPNLTKYDCPRAFVVSLFKIAQV
jgi:hypothetical protein